MAGCEKCWNDAYTRSRCTGKSQAECYSELIIERKDNPCNAEQQAGADRTVCLYCGLKTVHQYTKICMNCFKDSRS